MGTTGPKVYEKEAKNEGKEYGAFHSCPSSSPLLSSLRWDLFAPSFTFFRKEPYMFWPEEAFISLVELKAMYDKSDNHGGGDHGPKYVPVIALSHFWRTKAHPDPEGVTLAFIGKALEEHMPHYAKCGKGFGACGSVGYEDMGLFIDWCSLFQEPRDTPAMLSAFKGSLAHINIWYASLLTTVYFVTDEPAGLVPYHSRGWTTFEYLISWLLQWGSFKPWDTGTVASQDHHEPFMPLIRAEPAQ